MEFMNFFTKKETAPKFELSSLDIKGREIAGLESKPEKFSILEKNIDYHVLVQNNEIKTTTSLEEQFVFVNPTGGTETKMVEAPHWRTISNEGIHAVYESADKPEYYYTSNIKGVGYLKPTLKGGYSLDEYEDWKRTDEGGNKVAYGIADNRDFFIKNNNLVDRTKELTKGGLRTELFWAVADLSNVYYKGAKTPVSKLRSMNVIPKDPSYQLEMAVRLLKTNTRIAEVKDAEPEKAKELFTKAFDVFNKETQDKKLDLPQISLGDPESEQIYFREFFKRMGENVAVFQNLDYIGTQIHSANVTLAAEIVDTGGYQKKSEFMGNKEMVEEYRNIARGALKDMRDVSYDLKYLLAAGKKIEMSIPQIDELVAEYITAFKNKLNKNIETLEQAITAITTAVLIEEKHLGALKHGTKIEDWKVLGEVEV